MKILLVSPCPPKEQRDESMAIPQLTLSLIAGLTPEEHEVEICEEVFGDVLNYDGDYDVVGISLMTQTCIRGYQIANEFRKRDKVVIFGGIHATTFPKEAIMFGDAVVMGEAEGLWDKVLKDIENNILKKFYKLDVFPDLQNYIAPRRDLIKCSSGKISVEPIESCRGCPYNCDFCTVSRHFGTKQRYKPVEAIIEEAASSDATALFFLDDNIALNKKYARKLFEGLIGLNKVWVGQSSVNFYKDEEMMKLAHKSGCRALLIGFESMTDDGVNTYRKTLKSINENVEAVRRLRNNGILTMASLIFGLDSDTEAVFDLSMEFLTRSKPAFFQACCLTPYPGTPVFERLKAEKRILTDNWSKYDATKVLIRPKNMTPEKLYEGYNQVKKEIYSNNSILRRAFPHIKLGIKEILFYLSLNRGYQKHNHTKRNDGVQYNLIDHKVDFDVSKYVEPYKNTQAAVSAEKPLKMYI